MSQTSEKHRLKRKLLFVSPTIPPVPIAVSFVVKNLLSQIHPDDVVIATERCPENPADQTEMVGGFPVNFISKKWVWPKRGQKYLHWVRWILVLRTARRIIRLVKKNNCQAIFCNFPDEQLLLASYFAARKLKLPFYSFFHNTYRENRSGWRRWIADYSQPRVFALSRQVFVMSKGMQLGWEKLYPQFNFKPLVHTFSEEIPAFEPLTQWSPKHIQIGFLGSVNDSNLDAMKRFCELVRQDTTISWSIYSNASDWFLQKEGLAGERITHESPSDAELNPKLRSNDVLFLPHGFTGGLTPIEYETIFPTRTIPYLISGRPIIAFSPAHSYLNHWLRENDCAEIVDQPDTRLLRERIDFLRNNPARCEQLVKNALKAAEQFQAKRVVSEFVAILNQG